jgi:hypothetical protein
MNCKWWGRKLLLSLRGSVEVTVQDRVIMNCEILERWRNSRDLCSGYKLHCIVFLESICCIKLLAYPRKRARPAAI